MKFEEEKIIEGKKIKIKIKPSEVDAWVGTNLKVINITEKIKRFLKKEEYNAIIMHERGHLEIKNFIISLIPILVIMGLLVLAYDSIMNLILLLLNASTFMTLFILLFLIPLLIVFESILELPSRWTIEILADKYAIERTKKGVFSKALKKVYDYHKKYTPFSIGKLRRRYVLHPPIRIRLWVIKQFEKNKQ